MITIETMIRNKLYQLRKVLTDGRIANLDRLDAAVSSRLSSTDAATQFTALATNIEKRAQRTKVVIWDTPGAGTFTVPEGVYLVWLSMCGGGGGGLMLGANGSGSKKGCTGGSAASVVRLPIAVTPGQVISFIVGAAGLGLRDSATAGYIQAGNGGDTVFGTITAPGGKGGYGNWNSGTPVVNPTTAAGGIFLLPAGMWSPGSPAYPAAGLGYTAVSNFVDGVQGQESNSYCAPTPLAGFNFAGVGGVAFSLGTQIYWSRGGNGVIVIEMECAS